MTSAQQTWRRLSTDLWKAINTRVGDQTSEDPDAGSGADPHALEAEAPSQDVEGVRDAPVLAAPGVNSQCRTNNPPSIARSSDELVYKLSRANFRAQSASLHAQFPDVDDTTLYSLFPALPSANCSTKSSPCSPQTLRLRRKDSASSSHAGYEQAQVSEARRCVRAALNEMKLNFDLDPGLLGERSDISRGYAQIAWLLSHLKLSHPHPELLQLGEDDDQRSAQRGNDPSSPDQSEGADAGASQSTGGKFKPSHKPKRPYESHDLLKAIDRHDIETIISIRDHAFDLLLDISAGAATTGTSDSRRCTPLGYAMGLGPAYEDVCIVLVGTLSRFVNLLPDIVPENNKVALHDSFRQVLDPATMSRLRKIRTNLKLAIDTSLASRQTSLLASYCQVLIMSEGAVFIHNAVAEVQLAIQHRLRGTGGASHSAYDDPFQVALGALLKFFTQNLRSEQKQRVVGQAQEYLDNASGDLILMALWGLIMLTPREARNIMLETLHAQGAADPEERADELMQDDDESQAIVPPALRTPIPAFYFARDERVTSYFEAQVRCLEEHAYPRPRSMAPAIKKACHIAHELALAGRMGSSQRLALLRTLL